MTDMTAEQALAVLADNMRDKDAGVTRLGIYDNNATRAAIAWLIDNRQALSAPRAPEGWRDFVAEVVESAEGYESRSGNKVNGDWVARGRALLAAAPAPADVALTNEGDMVQAADSGELTEPAQDELDMETELAAKDWVIGNLQLNDRHQEAEIAKLREQIGGIGNELHNLSCRYQNDEELCDALSGIRDRLWQMQSAARLREGGA